MSVNGKFEGITRADLLELGDRFIVPSPARIIDEILDAVDRWSTFAEAADVDGEQARRIAASLETFRPR
jgi:serine/threonine-protein kinase HipA